MAHLDGGDGGANGWGVAPRRTKSGMVPAPRATPAQWAQLLAVVREVARVAGEIEDATGDPDIRDIRDGAEEEILICQELSFVRTARR